MKGINTFKRLSSLELNAGISPVSRNWLERVDLKIKGGAQIFKTLRVCGNIEMDHDLVVRGDLSTGAVYAGNISSNLSKANVKGNLCGNIVVRGDTVVNNLKTTGNFTTGTFERYGWLGSRVNSSMEDTSVCANDNNTITFINSMNRNLMFTDKQSIVQGMCNCTGVSAAAFGNRCVATGDYSHAEGNATISSGLASHSENVGTIATGDYSHAEGCLTTSSGFASFSSGKNTTSSGRGSHSEGLYNTVSGACSHVEGVGCKITSDYSYVEGRENISTSLQGMDHIEGLKCKSVSKSTSKSASTSALSFNSSNTMTGHNNHNDHTDRGGHNVLCGLNHVQGELNTATGFCGHIEGSECVGESKYVHVGGCQAKADQYSQWARSAGKINKIGDAQTSIFHLRTKIVGSTRNQLDLVYPEEPKVYPVIKPGNCWMFELQLVGKDTTSKDYYATKINGMAYNLHQVQSTSSPPSPPRPSSPLRVMSNVVHIFSTGTLKNTKVRIEKITNNSGFEYLDGSFVVGIKSSSPNVTKWAATLIATQA